MVASIQKVANELLCSLLTWQVTFVAASSGVIVFQYVEPHGVCLLISRGVVWLRWTQWQRVHDEPHCSLPIVFASGHICPSWPFTFIIIYLPYEQVCPPNRHLCARWYAFDWVILRHSQQNKTYLWVGWYWNRSIQHTGSLCVCVASSECIWRLWRMTVHQVSFLLCCWCRWDFSAALVAQSNLHLNGSSYPDPIMNTKTWIFFRVK